MKLLLVGCLCVVSASLLTSCETTGDPRQGGLFGWSESKAQDRIDARQQKLDQLDSDSANVDSSNSRMQRKLNDE